MAYNTYASNYNTMYKINGKYVYSDITDFSQGEIVTAAVSILQDSQTGKFIVENKLIREIIHVALGHYTCNAFGYSESSGRIWVSTELTRTVEEPYYIDYFSTRDRKVLKYKDVSYILEPVYIDGKEHININDLGTALGFSFSMEKDDTNRIQLIKVAAL